MRAWAILFFARTRRCAVVASGSRNARAISRVESPQSVRSASAICAGTASAGWQHVNSSRSRSSGTASSSAHCASGASSCSRRRCASPTCRRDRRSRSTARRWATAVIHAPGRSGIPESGQTRRARSNASCRDSSARSKSPPRRPMRPARMRGPSRRASSSTIRPSIALHSGEGLSGRTSQVPCFAPGHFDAQSTALSRSGTSIR